MSERMLLGLASVALLLFLPVIATAWTPQMINVDGVNDFLGDNLLDPDAYPVFEIIEVSDIDPPVLEQAEHLEDYQLRLQFSEAVDVVTAENASNYSVDGAGVDSARVDGLDHAIVTLYLDQDLLATGDVCSVTVTNVEDEAGNPIRENGTDNVAHFFIKGVLFRGHMSYHMRGWIPGSSLQFSVEGTPEPLTWTLCDNLTGTADADTVFSAYAEFTLECDGLSGPCTQETIYFKFVHNCILYESLPQNRTHVLTSATARDTLDLWWENEGPRERGPYLSWQNDPSSTMTVSWQTIGKGTSRVDYGPDASYGDFVEDPALVEWHALELTSLNSGDTYHYQASSSTGFVSNDHTLTTGGTPGDPYVFLVYGDTRTDSIPHQSVVDWMETETEAFFILHTGDLVEHGGVLEEWNTFFDITKDLFCRMAFMPSIGNHEDNHQNYFDFFALPNNTPPSNEQWYSFDVGGAHYVALSTETTYSVGSSQYNWLVSDLAAASATADWIFVYFHKPPFSSGSHGSDLDVRNTFCPVFETYGVNAVFNGHDHIYERSFYNGITYIVAGGGGAPLRDVNLNPNPYQQYAERTYHYCRVTLDRFQCYIEAIKPNGTVFDSLMICSTDVALEDEFTSPRRTELVGVFPNPSAAGVEIRYALAREVPVDVAVYDVRGRHVKTLDQASPQRGLHAVHWDRTDGRGRNVSPGVYWVRLTTDEERDVRKIVLVE